MKNYFDWFQIPVQYHIDARALKKKYVELSRTHHPDYFAQAGEEAAAEALRQTSLNNEAYKALSNPSRRLEYLLQLFGLLDNNLSAAAALPNAFLMEMMELNERVEEIENQTPEAQKQRADEAKMLWTEIQQFLKEQNAAIDKEMFIFDSLDNEADRKNVLEKTLKIYLERKYILRVSEKVSTFAALSTEGN